MKLQLNSAIYSELKRAADLSGLSMSEITDKAIRWYSRQIETNADIAIYRNLSADSGREQIQIADNPHDSQFVRLALSGYLQAKRIKTPIKQAFPYGLGAMEEYSTEQNDNDNKLPFSSEVSK